MSKLLPIGSVVLLENAKQKIFIVGFRGMIDDSSVVYDYIGYPYPFGFTTRDVTLLFNHNDIKEIFYEGYKNNEEIEFKQELQNYILNKNNEEEGLLNEKN